MCFSVRKKRRMKEGASRKKGHEDMYSTDFDPEILLILTSGPVDASHRGKETESNDTTKVHEIFDFHKN